MEGCGQIEDRPAMLNRNDAPDRKTAAVARAVDFINDR